VPPFSNPTKITPEEIADASNESYLFVPQHLIASAY
jgi:hypothetical protein